MKASAGDTPALAVTWFWYMMTKPVPYTLFLWLNFKAIQQWRIRHTWGHQGNYCDNTACFHINIRNIPVFSKKHIIIEMCKLRRKLPKCLSSGCLYDFFLYDTISLLSFYFRYSLKNTSMWRLKIFDKITQKVCQKNRKIFSETSISVASIGATDMIND
jgi:hypothetical protein